MRGLTAQPPAFWIALLALLVSMVSLSHTLMKSRRERQLDTLGRRSQLLFKLIDAESKATIAKMNLGYSRSILGQLNSHRLLQGDIATTFFPQAANDLQEFNAMQEDLERRFTELEAVVDRLRSNCGTLGDNDDPKKIETLMPEAQRLQAGIDTFSILVATATTRLEGSLKILDSTLADLKNSAPGNQ
jgi:hypothetical protein